MPGGHELALKADRIKPKSSASTQLTPEREIPSRLPPAAPTTRPAPIDWARQAEQVARDITSIGGLDAGSRSAMPQKKLPAIPWTHAAKGRIEVTPGGATLIWLNERCALVVFILVPLVTCKFGPLPADGEIFAAIKQAQPGDWK
jgi:hypothetical protein